MAHSFCARSNRKGSRGVATDVAGDVFFGVVRPHLFLVDVLLEDVAEHVGVDLVVVTQRAVVEMPLVGVEELEDVAERRVGDMDARVVPLKVVHLEQAAVQVGHPPQQVGQFRRPVLCGLAQPFVEQAQQEQPVEGLETVPAVPGLQAVEAVAQVIDVAVEKAALLDEVDEHHAVEHQRGVPFAVGHSADAVDEAQEGAVFLLEAVVEAFGDLVDVEGGAHPSRDVHDAQVGFFVQGEGQLFQLLDECFAGVVLVVDVLARPGRLTWLAPDPLPDLPVVVVRDVDDEVFVNGLGDGSFDLVAGGLIGEGAGRIRPVLVDDHAALLGDGLEGKGSACGGYFQVFAAVVPAEFVDEQGLQGEILQMVSDFLSVEDRRH